MFASRSWSFFLLRQQIAYENPAHLGSQSQTIQKPNRMVIKGTVLELRAQRHLDQRSTWGCIRLNGTCSFQQTRFNSDQTKVEPADGEIGHGRQHGDL